MTLPDIKRIMPFIGTGLISTMLPGIIKGLLLGFFKDQKVNSKILTQWVQEDSSLWSMLAPKWQRVIRDQRSRLGDTKWFTPDWLIDAVKGDYPSIASLFLGWVKAAAWLKNQVEEIKREISQPIP